MARKSALIVGFLGRKNSGDDLMFEMHKDLLTMLGFESISWWTEFQADSCIGTTFRPDVPYDLVIVGGGSLDFGYGMHAVLNCAFRRNSKVIYSSISYPRIQGDISKYVRIIQSVADLVILRNKSQLDAFPRNSIYLPDISTAYQPEIAADRDGIAVILRNEAAPFVDFAPADPFDVLILSAADHAVSLDYALQAGARTVYFMEDEHPKAHVDLIRRYKRVLSLGRLHAALYAQDRDTAYLFGRVPPKRRQEVQAIEKRLSWTDIKRLNEEHKAVTKLGIFTTEIGSYGRATLEQYANAYKSVLGA